MSLLGLLLLVPEGSPLGGLTPKPSTLVESEVFACFWGGKHYSLALPVNLKSILVSVGVFILLIAYMYYFLPKLPNDVKESTVRHETFNSID